MLLLRGFIKYTTFIGILFCVLMVVISGVQISISGISQKQQTEGRERIFKTLTGLAFLFLVAFILNTIAPWVYS